MSGSLTNTFTITKSLFLNSTNQKKEYYIMDVYPLTAEEFEQTEKVTSPEVLTVINSADVEVE